MAETRFPFPINALINFPVSLYIHVPFCEAKCAYCSFYSIVMKEGDAESWLRALEREAAKLHEYFSTKIPLRTIYIGGGTPSFLPFSAWEKLISLIKKFFDTDNCEEATAEANPNSLSRELISLWRDNFITRVSLGVQSLNDTELKVLGRLHDSRKARDSMELVKSSGLDLNADLIFGIPGQNIRSWNESLRGVISHGADHISTYQLTLEPDTRLARELGDKAADLNSSGYYFYRYAQFFLPRKGFSQYEISNFAVDGCECRHNLAYWRQENVMALGPGAWGYIEGMRYKNPGTLKEYIDYTEKKFPAESITRETLSSRERAIECAILALRTRWGIDRNCFISKWGEKVMQTIENALSNMPENLFCRTPESIALSPKGMRVGNSIWSELIDI